MEHYDWNDGWLFCPTFDPALVRPECTGLELESVRIPHTVKASWQSTVPCQRALWIP